MSRSAQPSLFREPTERSSRVEILKIQHEFYRLRRILLMRGAGFSFEEIASDLARLEASVAAKIGGGR
jgi:hypothetical protein